MSKIITEKQLIESLKQLKEIKPRKEWAVLLKSQILAGEQTEFLEQPARFAGFANIFSQRKMAYAFSVVLLLIVGVFGAIKLLPTTNIPQQTASLTGQAVLKQNVEALNIKINNLSNTTKANKVAINDINANVSALAKTLAKNPTKDSATIKEIANSLKTLANVPGTDLTTNPDVQNLTKTVVQSEIADYQKTTLTDSQKEILVEAEGLYGQGNYSGALEKIWYLANNDSNNSTNLPSLTDTTSPANK